MKMITIAVVAIVLVAGAYMLVSNDDDGEKQERITIQGSTTVNPIMMAVQSIYEKDNNVILSITANGSSTGASAAINGTADIGMMSRDLKDKEIAAGLVATIIGIDGIAVIINDSVSGINDLTLDQLADIYSGKITNWSAVGGPDSKINLVSREDGSGTRDGFESSLKKADPDFKVATEKIELGSTNAVMKTVDSTKGSIGYISVGYTKNVGNSTNVLSVDGVKASTSTILDGTYVMQRNLLLVTKGQPSGAAADFINWIMSSEGQKIVEEENFIPVA